ncbi:glutathione S-transferase [Mycena vulgaris]|nr:glutathione S-transferase [Mycena vulgaris]
MRTKDHRLHCHGASSPLLSLISIFPYAHRLSLAEVEVDFTHVEIDLRSKLEWCVSKVNPASRVCAVPLDQPSSDSVRIIESLILVEFVADLYLASALLPTVLAQARLFIDIVSTKFGAASVVPFTLGESFAGLWDVLEALKSLLLPADKPFAVDDQFTPANIALAPFFVRMEVALKNDIGASKAGEGMKAAEYFFSSGRFARLVFDAIKVRESFKTTFDEQVQAAGIGAAAWSIGVTYIV